MNTFKYGNEQLEIIDSTHDLVPKSASDVVLSDTDKTALAIAIKSDIPTLLIGEAGTGKSSAVKYLAHMRKQPYVRINMNGYTTPDELVGRIAVKKGSTYFEDGMITYAMRIGAILVLDEVNGTTQDCLFVLHGLLDQDKQITLPNGTVIKPHKDFRVFATMNPDYEGTKSLNKAFLDRFGIIISVDTLDPIAEQKLLVERTGITPDQANAMISIASIARKDYFEHKISVYISTRTLLNMANLVKQGMSLEKAYQVAIVYKSTIKDEQRAMRDFYLAIMKQGENLEAQQIVFIEKNKLDTLESELNESKNLITSTHEKLKEHITQLNDFKEKSVKLIKERDKLIKMNRAAVQKNLILRKQIQEYKTLEKFIKKNS